ncbi:MAG: hypothetical protein HRT72_10220 [Flavobacteriales bacterium]|nr:hypothetical protein [Flavobacteriales bacterium]
MNRFYLLVIVPLLIIGGCSKSIVQLPPIEVKPNLAQSEFVVGYKPSAKKVNDITHTKLELSFSYDKKEVYGIAELTVKPHFLDVAQLILDAKYFDIHNVSLLNEDGVTQSLNFEYDSLKLTIELDRSYAAEEEYTVQIKYTAHPHDVKDAASQQGLFFVDVATSSKKSYQIWSQGETEMASSWFPTNDRPNEKYTQEIYLTVDTNFTTLSNGLLVFTADNGNGTKTDYWKQLKPHAPYLTAIIIGDFAVVKDEWKGIEVSYYVEPDYVQYARNIFGRTPEMIDFYSKKLGYSFPWEKFSQVIVRDFEVAYAMENTSAVVNHTNFQKTKRELLDGDDDATISHELFHHWFGNLVTAESWANLSLNESFATYGEYLWFEHDKGMDAADYHLSKDLKRYISGSKSEIHDLVWFDHPHRKDMFDVHSYQKGACILHMLRNYLGDKVFFASLEHYLTENEYQDAEVHHLRMAFEEISGEDLNWFFNQWFYGKGHPELKITYSYDEQKKSQIVYIDQEQDLAVNGIYRLPIKIDIYHDGKVDSFKVVIDKVKNRYSFDVATKPDLVNVDADKMLLCEKEDAKSKEEIVFQYYNAPKFIDRLESIKDLYKSYQDDEVSQKVFVDALDDSFWKIKLKALTYVNDSLSVSKISLKEKVIQMAQHDSESYVRVYALNHLADYYKGDADISAMQEQALNDSSFYVNKTGLINILNEDEKKGRSLAKRFEKEGNSEVLIGLSNFYSENGTIEDNEFFISTMKSIDTYSREYLIGNYALYLTGIKNDSVVKLAIPILESISREDNLDDNRLASLLALKDLEWHYVDVEKSGKDKEEATYLKKKIAEIIEISLKEEKDKEVISEYENYILFEIK